MIYRAYKNHYLVLGLGPQSTQMQIKTAFRKLSMRYHPDKNENSEQANRIFRIILNAYQILSDDKKREEYDAFIQKSDYIRKFGSNETSLLDGRSSGSFEHVLENINITLWDIDDMIRKQNIEGNSKRYILIILTFLDKWILEPYGFPDYYMEARRLDRIDPREYVNTLGEKKYVKRHQAYSSLTDYYADLRKRADKFLARYLPAGNRAVDADAGAELFGRIIEYSNMAMHYLSYLLNNSGDAIPPFVHSDEMYDYPY